MDDDTLTAADLQRSTCKREERRLVRRLLVSVAKRNFVSRLETTQLTRHVWVELFRATFILTRAIFSQSRGRATSADKYREKKRDVDERETRSSTGTGQRLTQAACFGYLYISTSASDE